MGYVPMKVSLGTTVRLLLPYDLKVTCLNHGNSLFACRDKGVYNYVLSPDPTRWESCVVLIMIPHEFIL